MASNGLLRATAIAVCLGLAAEGCQTYPRAGALGAAVGAGAGAIIGHQSGRALEGAAIGAVIGGAAGLIAHDIKVRRQRTAQQTAEDYNYRPAQGEMLSFERAEVLPPVVRAGEMIESEIQYALLGSGNGVQITETRALYRGDQLIAELSAANFVRTDGTWVSTQPFRLPRDLRPGVYTIVQRVRTAQSTVSGRAEFTVQ